MAGTRRGLATDEDAAAAAVRDPSSKRARQAPLPTPRAGARSDSAHFVNFGRAAPNVGTPMGHRIFGYLSAEDRSRAGQVCRQWRHILSSRGASPSFDSLG